MLKWQEFEIKHFNLVKTNFFFEERLKCLIKNNVFKKKNISEISADVLC